MSLCKDSAAAAAGTFALAYGAGAEARAAAAVAAGLTRAAVDAVASARLAPLGALPAPAMSSAAHDLARTAAKMFSIMRVNTLAPEGVLNNSQPIHWSTPDRTPHKAMWLWDSCFHAIGRAVVEPALVRRPLPGTASH
jgi:hypothetical protein